MRRPSTRTEEAHRPHRNCRKVLLQGFDLPLARFSREVLAFGHEKTRAVVQASLCPERMGALDREHGIADVEPVVAAGLDGWRAERTGERVVEDLGHQVLIRCEVFPSFWKLCETHE